MNNLLKSIVIAAAVAGAAFAQGYSNPVREMEKPGRSAVFGQCSTNFDAGYSGFQADCLLRNFDQQLGDTVPDGKVLVIEDVSGICTKALADAWGGVSLTTGIHIRQIPPVLLSSFNGRGLWTVASPVRMYVKAGGKVSLGIALIDNGTQNTNCVIKFAGYFENVQ
ncbi:MAG: hypothetical protein ABI972_21360 [Acidobacteriota bacterium]